MSRKKINGFNTIKCSACGHEYLLAFSFNKPIEKTSLYVMIDYIFFKKL